MALGGKSKGAKAKKEAEKRLRKAKGKASKGAGNALDWAAPRFDYAKDVAAATATDARNWAEPRLKSARHTVETEVIPRVQNTWNEAAANAGPAVEEAKVRGTRALAALKGEVVPPPPRKKKHRARKVMLVLLGTAVVGGIAVAVWSRRTADGFDYYSLPADDFGSAGNGAGYGSDAPLGSVTAEGTRAGETPAQPYETPDASATEAAEAKHGEGDDDGSGKHRRGDAS